MGRSIWPITCRGLIIIVGLSMSDPQAASCCEPRIVVHMYGQGRRLSVQLVEENKNLIDRSQGLTDFSN